MKIKQKLIYHAVCTLLALRHRKAKKNLVNHQRKECLLLTKSLVS